MRRSFRFLDWTARPAHIAAQFQWEPRDLWIGVFWRLERWRAEITGWDRKHGDLRNPWSLHIYVCLVPTVPLHIYVMRTLRPPRLTHAEDEPSDGRDLRGGLLP